MDRRGGRRWSVGERRQGRARSKKAGRWAAAAGVAALTCACAPGPPPAPAPVTVEEPPGQSPVASSQLDPTYGLEAVPALPPPALWIPPRVSVRPPGAAEGSAVAVHLRRSPAGRDPLFVDADLDGVPVHLTRTPWGWFGVGALPIGSAGRRTLALRYGVAPDSVEERLLSVPVVAREWPSTRLGIGSRTRDLSPEVEARLERERATIRATVERATPDWLAADGFDWPRRDRTTSPFGQRRTFRGEVRSLHLGLDVAGRTGDPIRSAGTGRVALTGRFLLQGNAVWVDHGLGVYTAYYHLSRIEVVEGDFVVRGDLLGRVGATGRVTGPHLHWSLYVAGQSVDPRSLLELPLHPEPPGAAGSESGGT